MLRPHWGRGGTLKFPLLVAAVRRCPLTNIDKQPLCANSSCCRPWLDYEVKSAKVARPTLCSGEGRQRWLFLHRQRGLFAARNSLTDFNFYSFTAHVDTTFDVLPIPHHTEQPPDVDTAVDLPMRHQRHHPEHYYFISLASARLD